jgi:hypothetical protein
LSINTSGHFISDDWLIASSESIVLSDRSIA